MRDLAVSSFVEKEETPIGDPRHQSVVDPYDDYQNVAWNVRSWSQVDLHLKVANRVAAATLNEKTVLVAKESLVYLRHK